MTDTPDPLVKVARDLREIAHLDRDLPLEAVNRSADREMPGGDALAFRGPVANLEAWEHQLAAAEARGEHPDDAGDDGGETPLQKLRFWSEQWRVELGAESDRRMTVESEANFIRRNLTWAWATEVHFNDFANDVHEARAMMEAVLHDGIRSESGAPCLQCDEPLRRRVDKPSPCDCNLAVPHGLHREEACCIRCRDEGYHAEYCDQGGVFEGWWYCLNDECVVFEIDDEEYRRNVGARHLEHATELTASDMEHRFGVKASVVRVWGARERIRKRGANRDGITLYDVADVEARLRHAEDDEVA